VNPEYLLPALLIAYAAWRGMAILRVRRRVPALLAGGAQIVDVRTREEFAAEHATGSINIPLNELPARVHELDPARSVVVCCASGMRSSAAARILRSGKFPQVCNAGSWRLLPRPRAR